MTVSGVGVSTEAWLDPNSTPTRLNPKPEHPHKFNRIVGATGAPRFSITHDTFGFEPADAALGGDLFTWWWVEQLSRDVVGDLPIPIVAAQSSVVLFTAGDFEHLSPASDNNAVGHYLLAARRQGSGIVAIPFLVTG